VFVLPEDVTVADAMRRVRRSARTAFFYPYVVDRNQRLVGILTARELMLASPRRRLAEIMHRQVVRLSALATSREVKQIGGRRAFPSVPVVDEDDVLIGVIDQQALKRFESARTPVEESRVMTDGLAFAGGAYLRMLSTLIMHMAGSLSGVLEDPEPGETRHAP
jgi:predicted transcriptional regulator